METATIETIARSLKVGYNHADDLSLQEKQSESPIVREILAFQKSCQPNWVKCPHCSTYWSKLIDGKCFDCNEKDKQNIKNKDLNFLPQKYRKMTFEKYKIETQTQKEAYDAVVEYGNPASKSNLILSGFPGVGKTHLGCAIAIELQLTANKAAFESCPKLISEFMQGYETERRALERMYNAKYLILDDLGSGIFNFKAIENQKFLRNFFDVIDTRDAREKNRILITTNMQITDFSNIDDRLSSRMSVFKYIRISGRDFRGI
jgi:DNA replication protein DnaC